MLFNSFEFLLFLPVVVWLHFAIPHRWRWILLLAASYYFYAYWKLDYLVLIVLSTLVNYYLGIQIDEAEHPLQRKQFLIFSICFTLGILFLFKYFNFASDSLQNLLTYFDISYSLPTLNLLLPIGISFYTFQTLSYCIDLYQGKRKAEKHLGIFALYVVFFPQLVAGPIEKSTTLLPQFYQKHQFSYPRTLSGLTLILCGFFKKIVIADRLAIFVDAIYGEPNQFDVLPLTFATYCFAFQIYGDFSGYSDIAIGSAKILGYDLTENFRRPYLARSVREFWQRWHVSLSQWFRDYIYIPLGGNRVPVTRIGCNLLLVFLISGLWHGAQWTFVIWGGLHGLYLVASMGISKLIPPSLSLFSRRWINHLNRTSIRWIQHGLQIVLTFHLVLLAWVFFRANSLDDAAYILGQLPYLPSQILTLGQDWFSQITANQWEPIEGAIALFAVGLMTTIHFIQEQHHASQMLQKPTWLNWAVCYGIAVLVLIFGQYPENNTFIYFQF